jgi:hypothetical protein
MKKLPSQFKLRRTISISDGGTLPDGERIIHVEDRDGNTSDEDDSPVRNSPRSLTPLPVVRSRSEPLNMYSFFSSRLNPVIADLKADFAKLSSLFQLKKNPAHRVKSDENLHRHQKNREPVNRYPHLSVELEI